MDPEQIPLRDLHLPEAIGWWPPAPGWWLLAGVLLAALAWVLVRAWRRWRRERARRLALRELARLRREHRARPDPVALGARLSVLLRRTMLAYGARGEVAGLTGERWLEWLDRGLEDRPFSAGPGRSLAELPYRAPASRGAAADVDGLLDAVRLRLATPLPEVR